jgi:hypothetical protein
VILHLSLVVVALDSCSTTRSLLGTSTLCANTRATLGASFACLRPLLTFLTFFLETHKACATTAAGTVARTNLFFCTTTRLAHAIDKRKLCLFLRTAFRHPSECCKDVAKPVGTSQGAGSTYRATKVFEHVVIPEKEYELSWTSTKWGNGDVFPLSTYSA